MPGSPRSIAATVRSEEHTSELQSPVVISYAVFCLKKKTVLAAGVDRVELDRIACVVVPDLVGCAQEMKRGKLSRRYHFFFNDPATTEIYTTTDTLSLHDALPICPGRSWRCIPVAASTRAPAGGRPTASDRKSTRLNSSHRLLSRMPSSA